jgi:hypothetical protein
MAAGEEGDLDSDEVEDLESDVCTGSEAIAEGVVASEIEAMAVVGATATTVGEGTLGESGGSGSSPWSAKKRFDVVIFSAGLSGLKPCTEDRS